MKKECRYGFIEWRKPNLEEGLQLMESFEELKKIEGIYSGIGESLKVIFPLFKKIEIKVCKKQLKTIEDFQKIAKVPLMTFISALKNDIYAEMFDLDEVKKP